MLEQVEHGDKPKARKKKNKFSDSLSTRLARQDWIDAAVKLFSEEGIDAVMVEPIAQRLEVTRGSFYWHFKNREHLLEEILAYWSEHCTSVMLAQIEPLDDIIDVVLTLFEMWMKDEPFAPHLDAAVRDWARRSPQVREAVAQADDVRSRAIAEAFRRSGYGEREALIRARILYNMQIGYYEANIREPLDVRVDFSTEYILVFTGLQLSEERKAAYRQRFDLT
jgi:AcrR family transcriptional regulator